MAGFAFRRLGAAHRGPDDLDDNTDDNHYDDDPANLHDIHHPDDDADRGRR